MNLGIMSISASPVYSSASLRKIGVVIHVTFNRIVKNDTTKNIVYIPILNEDE